LSLAGEFDILPGENSIDNDRLGSYFSVKTRRFVSGGRTSIKVRGWSSPSSPFKKGLVTMTLHPYPFWSFIKHEFQPIE
jgi:hypothetical protein